MTESRLVLDASARGFHEQTLSEKFMLGGRLAERRRRVYVRDGYRLIACDGEAHRNAHIDNCGLCMRGEWGWKPVRSGLQVVS